MKLYIVPLSANRARKITPLDEDENPFCSEWIKRPNISYFVSLNDTPLGMGGVVYVGNGIWTFWSVTDRNAHEKYKLSIFKAFKKGFKCCVDKVKALGGRRIQCYAVDKPRAVKLNEILGFKQEGHLKGYMGEGEDSVIMGMLL